MNKKRRGVRVCITLDAMMMAEYREIAKMTGFTVSRLIRRRLEVRGGIVAVPEDVTKELRSIHGLIEYAVRTGMYDPNLLDAWKNRVEVYDRLIDFASQATFLYGKKKARTSSQKNATVPSHETNADPLKESGGM